MHVLWPIFLFKLNGVGYKNVRNGLGHFLVEVRSMSMAVYFRKKKYQVKKGQILNLIFLHKMGIESMHFVTASLMVVVV